MISFDAEIVDTAALSFAEQAELFASSNLIVGPSGASWANLLFCSPGTHGIIWTVDYHRDFTAFSNLAETTGSTLRRIDTHCDRSPMTSVDAYQASYLVNAQHLAQAIELALGKSTMNDANLSRS